MASSTEPEIESGQSRKKGWLLPIVALVALAVAAGYLYTSQPSYKVRKLLDEAVGEQPSSDWDFFLIEVGIRGPARRYGSIQDNIVALGRDAVPTLADTLRAKPTDVAELYRCVVALDVLGRMAKDVKEALPPIIEALDADDASVRRHAAYTLTVAAIHREDAFAAMINAVYHKDAEVRGYAVFPLRRRPATPRAVQALTDALSDHDVYVRLLAVEGLAIIGSSAAAAAPRVAALLQDRSSDVRVRAMAARALGNMGETVADVAVPALENALNDKDASVRAVATEALKRIREPKPDIEF